MASRILSKACSYCFNVACAVPSLDNETATSTCFGPSVCFRIWTASCNKFAANSGCCIRCRQTPTLCIAAATLGWQGPNLSICACKMASKYSNASLYSCRFKCILADSCKSRPPTMFFLIATSVSLALPTEAISSIDEKRLS